MISSCARKGYSHDKLEGSCLNKNKECTKGRRKQRVVDFEPHVATGLGKKRGSRREIDREEEGKKDWEKLNRAD